MTTIFQQNIAFIKKQLITYNACDFPVNKQKIVPQEVTLDTLEQILKTGVTDGPSMRAVQCLFQTIFSSEKDNKTIDYGLCRLKSDINSWFQNILKIGQGGFGAVYRASVIRENIQVVIKVPSKSGYKQEEILQEYLIGLALNNLRYLIPNFAYTLGVFACTSPVGILEPKLCTSQQGDFREFVVYEKIKGLSFFQMISHGKVTINDCILIIAMILLALEVAQREYQFTHYDLHPGNVMLVENMPDYEVVLDDVVYKITKPKYVPIIIDYGMSSIKLDDDNVGLNDEPLHNQYMVPDHDMYFLIYRIIRSYRVSTASFDDLDLLIKLLGGHKGGKQILERLSISTQKIPIGDMVKDRKDAETNIQYFLNNAPGASETPLQLFKRMFRDHSGILSGKIIQTRREKLYSLKYTSSIKTYYDILGDPKEGVEQAILNMKKCTQGSTSFILSLYQVYVLENCNKILASKNLDDFITTIRKNLRPSDIGTDITELNKVFDIKPPGSKWRHVIDDLVSISPFTEDEPKILAVKNSLELLDYFYEVKTYFDMYYTILELGLNKQYPQQYGNWVEKFRSSEQYRFYMENNDSLMEGLRWAKTLMASAAVNINVQNNRKLIRNSSYRAFWYL